jgi:hypothetical protein
MAHKLLIEEHTANPAAGSHDVSGRTETYDTFQLAASQYSLAMDYWANRGRIAKDGQKKFTCIIKEHEFWVTIELVSW